MDQQTNLQQNKMKNSILCVLFALLLTSCTNTNLIDVNVEVPENSWAYAKSVKATVEIKNPKLAYDVFFKIRNTTEYRYSNIYVIMRIKAGNKFLKDGRSQFQLAKADGQWTGKGSGDLYSNDFLLLKKFRFPKAGKYEIEVEQNMRDNPLVGVSDIGISVETSKQ